MAGTGKDNNTLRGKRLDLRDRSPEGRGAMQLLDVEKTDVKSGAAAGKRHAAAADSAAGQLQGRR